MVPAMPCTLAASRHRQKLGAELGDQSRPADMSKYVWWRVMSRDQRRRYWSEKARTAGSNLPWFPFNACVAHPVGKKEIAMQPRAQKAMRDELDRLPKKKVWDDAHPRE